MHQVIAPTSPEQISAYNDLIYKILRRPWHRQAVPFTFPDEPPTVHRAIFAPDGTCLAAGRVLHSEPKQARIRLVAVAPTQRGTGIGRLLMQALEQQAADWGCTRIILDARYYSIPFYLRLGYQKTADSYNLFGVIPHAEMQKHL
jgi:predicted GNAT family N-acyltransferase